MSRQKEEPVFNRVEELGQARGMTRQEVADALGVHYQTIGYLERGEYSPSLLLALRIAKVFDRRVEEIFSITPLGELRQRDQRGEMGTEREKRFYWVEGVTRDEVVKSLSDQRPTRLRERGVRRALVVVYSGLVVLLPMVEVLTDERKVRSYVEFMALVGLVLLYFVLRRSVRHIADAPDELLDERLILLRNAAYLIAYRWLGAMALPFMMVFYRLVSAIMKM